MAISCVYCGGRHDTSDEVRQCWLRNRSGAGHPSKSSPPLGPSPMVHLGRNLILEPDQDVPPAWSGARRVPVGAAEASSPAALVAELARLAAARSPCVFELDEDAAATLGAPQAITAPIHVLGARFSFEVSALNHLLWANSIDGRDPKRPIWQLAQRAVALGARPVTSGVGDVVLPDGTAVWLDGGPVRYTDPIEGVPVLHRIALEHGSLVPFESNVTTAELAPDQRAAVAHVGGASRVIAPAGSGKTRVLTERARHLITRWRLPGTAVCLVAFNKRAQEEMSSRVAALTGLQVRTLNAIALAIINGGAPFAAQPTSRTTITEIEVRRIIGRLVEFPRKRNSDPVALWIEALSVARLGLRDPSEVEALYDGDIDGFASVLPRFRDELSRSQSVDYDEQIVRAIEILLSDPGARAAAQHACRVLLVDEFQDLTPAHVLLVRLLAGPDGCVFGVGDDDQTIYGFNGADPQWLIDFPVEFPHAGDHALEVNYRCPADVVAAAATLLKHNARRVPKVIRAANQESGLVFQAGDDSVASATEVIAAAIDGGFPPGDIAVLTRVNSLLAPVQVALANAGVPTHGGVGPEFADRAAVRGSLAWLRMATTSAPLASVDVEEALRNPSRPLRANVAGWVAGQSSVAGLRRLAARLKTPREAQRVEEFAADIEMLRQLAASGSSTSTILARLHQSMGMASTLSTLDTHRRGMNRAAQGDDLVAIAQLALQQPDPATFETWLRAALRQPAQSHGVTLATVHRVKGKEWPVVIVHHAEADQFPHRLAIDAEEERRVFHVALTRGRTRVFVLSGARPSPFIDECLHPPAAAPPRVERASAKPGARPPRDVAAAEPDLSTSEAALFEELRAVRRHLAAGNPAYTVLSDRTLREISRRRPTTLAALADVKGVGPTKLERYGDALLAVVESATEDQPR